MIIFSAKLKIKILNKAKYKTEIKFKI